MKAVLLWSPNNLMDILEVTNIYKEIRNKILLWSLTENFNMMFFN